MRTTRSPQRRGLVRYDLRSVVDRSHRSLQLYGSGSCRCHYAFCDWLVDLRCSCTVKMSGITHRKNAVSLSNSLRTAVLAEAFTADNHPLMYVMVAVDGQQTNSPTVASLLSPVRRARSDLCPPHLKRAHSFKAHHCARQLPSHTSMLVTPLLHVHHAREVEHDV